MRRWLAYGADIISSKTSKLHNRIKSNSCGVGSVRLSAHAEVLPALIMQVKYGTAYRVRLNTSQFNFLIYTE